MKKQIFGLLCAILLGICLTGTVYASGNSKRVVDDAQILSDSEEAALEDRLENIKDTQGIDAVVVTKASLYGEDLQEFADDFYDYGGYGTDGMLLMVVLDEREWYISTAGYGIDAVTDAGLSYMAKQFAGDLGDGSYYEAFTIYADLCEDFVRQARSGEPYDTGNLPKGAFPFVRNLLTALVIGFVSALIATGVMKGKLKTVHAQMKADDYVKQGSLKVTHSKDLFLYTHVSKQPKPKETRSGGSHTHVSSSGTAHGGGGGKF